MHPCAPVAPVRVRKMNSQAQFDGATATLDGHVGGHVAPHQPTACGNAPGAGACSCQQRHGDMCRIGALRARCRALLASSAAFPRCSRALLVTGAAVWFAAGLAILFAAWQVVDKWLRATFGDAAVAFQFALVVSLVLAV